MNESSIQFQAEVQQKLTQYFDKSEIETMAFMLGVDYDSLRGGTKPTKVNALLAHMSRTGRLPDLLTYASKERPNAIWPAIPADFELPQGSAGSESDGVTVFQIGSLNTQGGAFIAGSAINGSDLSNSKSIQGDQVDGNKHVLSGTFTNSAINIESKLDDVTQTIQAMPNATPDQKDRLVQLIDALKTALAGLPATRAQDVLNITKRVEALASEAGSDLPDPEYINDLAESLKRAAEKVAIAAPIVAAIINSIIELVNAIAV
jgi:hypothetical protein